MDTVVRIRQGTTCTSVACGWLAPSSSQNVPYAETHEVDFSHPQTKMRRLSSSASIQNVKSHKPSGGTVNFDAFYSRLQAAGSKSVALSVLPNYGSDFVPKAAKLDLPKPLDSLYAPENQLLSEDELTVKASEVLSSMKVTDEQIDTVEKETRDQAKSSTWFQYHSGRVTASVFKAASRTRLEKPSVSLIHRICYPTKNKFSTKATRWGCEHEAKVRGDYHAYYSTKHDNLQVKECGMFIHKDFPFIGASPDGLVSCTCCGNGLLEIKCPFCHKDSTIGDASEDMNFCLETNNGVTELKKTRAYFYQVQCQLTATKLPFCDFCVYTGKELFIQRILPDEAFFMGVLTQVTKFYKLCILPELLAKRFTTGKDTVDSSGVENCEPVCVCKKSDPNKTLMNCAAEDCEIRVFHKECMGLKNKRKGWNCPSCRVLVKRKTPTT